MGESTVTRALCRLPDEYVLLNDLMLPDGKGSVDHLVIGPRGLFVIETKNYGGTVKCERDDWFVNGQKIGSLSRQAKRNAMAIKANLEKVFIEHKSKMPFVNALVFTKRGRLNVNQPTVPVLRSYELARFIRNCESNGRRPDCFSSELTRAIVHHLHSLQRHPTVFYEKANCRGCSRQSRIPETGFVEPDLAERMAGGASPKDSPAIISTSREFSKHRSIIEKDGHSLTF
jgi:nuclease-like protein